MTNGHRVAITDLPATIILTLILINHLVFAIFMQVYQLLAAVRSGFVVDGKLLISWRIGRSFMTPALGASVLGAGEIQEPLFAFLKTVLELSFSMLGTARLTAGRSQPAMEAVGQVLRVICSLEGRVEDPESRVAIHNRTIDLQYALDACSMLAS